MTFFFEVSVRPFEVVEVEWKSASKFWGCDLEFLKIINQKGKVDLCTTNGSKVLIYLTLLNCLLHYLQEYSKIWNIEKSNKSELWNRLSYRGLPYHFEVRSQTLFYDFQKFEVAASKFRGWFSFDLNDLERPKWEFKKNVME